MNIEKITPQIAALYLGQKCDVKWQLPFHDESAWEGIDIDNSVIEKLSLLYIEITPHLRRINSITEEEAQEVYLLTTGHEWKALSSDRIMPKQFGITGLNMAIGSPAAWLYLLGKGFDIFGLIPAGLAKDISK